MGYRYNAITGELDFFDSSESGNDITQIDADAGSASPIMGVVNLLGTAAQGVSSSAASNTVTLTIADATEIQKGVLELATDAEAIGGTDTSRAIVSTSLKAKLGAQTANALPYGTGDTVALGWTNALTDGQIAIGSTAGSPQAANITSTGATVAITNGANTINLEAVAAVPTSFVTDAGTASPALSILNVLGGNNISTVGAANNLTINLTGTTDHAIQIGNATGSLTSLGAGTTGELLIGNTGADPAFGSTAYADFSFNNITGVGVPRTLTIANTDVNVASTVDLRLSTPPLGGDSMVSWEVQGSHFFAAGVDNSVAGDPWKLSNSSAPSGGTAAIAVDAATAAVTFADAYEFPIADGNASDVLTTNGAAAVSWASVGSLLTDLDNILYVGKHGSDANNGKTPNNAKLTIQAAVTAAAAGDGIIVYPGTYTETVTHAANNVTLRAQGKPGTCVITQADANVVDINTQTGIFYDGFRIVCTAATTAKNTVQLSTGSATFRFCRLEMYSTAAIVAAAQPAIGAVTGAGTMIVAFGRHKYYHTGACGGTAQKGAFKVSNGGEVDLTRIEEFDIVNSGTALVSAIGVDTASTGNFKMNACHIDITDPNATNVVGLAYLGGTGTEHEFYRNEVHVTATNNTGYGFYVDDVAASSRFMYNHIHVTDVAGTSYSFGVGNTSLVVSEFDDITAADGVNLIAGGTFTCTSSLIDGDFTCRGREAAGIVQASIMNMDNTATASNAAVNISVGGTTSTGDPYTNYLVTGGSTYSVGIDNSDTDNFKITNGATPSAGTEYCILDVAASRWEFPTNIILQEISNVAGGVQNYIKNTDNSNAASDAFFKAEVGGTSGGDPYINFDVSGGSEFSTGIDNSDADAYKIGPNFSPSVGTSSIEVSTAGVVTFAEAYSFPVADGNADDVLTTDGAGGVTWQPGGGGGLTWALIAVNANIADGNGYIANKAGLLTMTLPAASVVGEQFAITNINTAAGWIIAQGANQYIRMGNQVSTVGAGGSLAATALGDTVYCVCTETDLGWVVISSVGNITVT